MRIKRDDKDGRQDWVLRGFRRFDAPVSVAVRDHTQLPDDQAIKICVAMGGPMKCSHLPGRLAAQGP